MKELLKIYLHLRKRITKNELFSSLTACVFGLKIKNDLTNINVNV